MKYKAAVDIPKLANKLNTLSPSEIANAASTEYNKNVTAISVSMWLQRHPETRKTLNEQFFTSKKRSESQKTIDKQKSLAQLYVNNALLFEIKDLQTLDCARKYLDIVEKILAT